MGSAKVGENAFRWEIVSEHVFQGSSALTLDAKGRVTVPARHRDVLMSLYEGQLTITHWNSGGFPSLMVWPRPRWLNARAELLKLPLGADAYRNFLIGSAMDVEIDSASRVLVSPELRAFAGIEREVVMRGVGGRLELWDKSRLDAHTAATMASVMPDAAQNIVL